jgi:hypothetical protein
MLIRTACIPYATCHVITPRLTRDLVSCLKFTTSPAAGKETTYITVVSNKKFPRSPYGWVKGSLAVTPITHALSRQSSSARQALPAVRIPCPSGDILIHPSLPSIFSPIHPKHPSIPPFPV